MKKYLIVFIVILFTAGVIYYAETRKVEVVEYQAEQVDEFADIRNRADILKQQELIVKETYLVEKKAKLANQIVDIEKELELVRKEKLSL